MLFDPTQELTAHEAKQLIREIVDLGNIIYGKHVNKRIKERNFTIRDVIYILKRGEVVDKEFNEEHQSWKYTIKGEDLEGDSGTVITAIIDSQRIFLITVC